jgi:HrpA-like RNA helicase
MKKQKLNQTHSSNDLPIVSYKDELISSIKNYSTTIVVGETGSGKSTQLPQYLSDYFQSLENNNIKNKKLSCVVCTQPRRVAAVTIAHRVADERCSRIGDEVGYSIRFDDKTSSKTRYHLYVSV